MGRIGCDGLGSKTVTGKAPGWQGDGMRPHNPRSDNPQVRRRLSSYGLLFPGAHFCPSKPLTRLSNINVLSSKYFCLILMDTRFPNSPDITTEGKILFPISVTDYYLNFISFLVTQHMLIE